MRTIVGEPVKAGLSIALAALLTACGGDATNEGGGGSGGVGGQGGGGSGGVDGQGGGGSGGAGGQGGGGSGGVGGGSVPATAATPMLTLAPVKTFHFSWNDVADATHYKLLENPDGASEFTQVGSDISQGSQDVDHVVPLYARVNAEYILQSCNAVGCADSATVSVSGTLIESIGYVKASNTDVGDAFGEAAVSLSDDGETLAVGAPFEDSNATGINALQSNNDATGAGAVYLFVRSGSTWAQQAYLKASNTDAADLFGFSLSLSGDGGTLAVGAPSEESNRTGVNALQSNNDAGGAGAVYLFVRSGSTWTQQAYLKASNTDAGDNFGQAVSLSDNGSTLAAGARFEDSNATGVNTGQANNDAGDAGAVYLFVRSGSTWTQQAYLKASNTDAGDLFGFSLSLSGDGGTLAVGAWREESNATGVNGDQINNGAPGAGAIYIFSRTVVSPFWQQSAYLKASNTDAEDNFGWAVSLSENGNTLAVGAPLEDGGATGVNTGQTNNDAGNAGAVYLFTRLAIGMGGGIWSQSAYLKASNTGAQDAFGEAVSLSGDGGTLAVGAPNEDSNATGVNGDEAANSASEAGASFVFVRSGSTWTQQAYLKASNTDAGDRFGSSLSLNADGNTLAVGAAFEESSATGLNTGASDNTVSRAGAVYLY